MRVAKIAFENVRAEMARDNLTIKSMAEGLNTSRETLSRKLSLKSPLMLSEAFEIQQMFFPTIEIEELFKELKNA